MKPKVIYVNFGKKKSKKLLWLLIPVAIIPVLLIWWFVHVNSQGGLMSLYPSEIKEQIAVSKNVTAEFTDGKSEKISVDYDIVNSLDESLWEQTTVKGALSTEADVSFNVKAGATDCEIRLLEEENVIIAIMNNYYRCYKLPEEQFKTLCGIFR